MSDPARDDRDASLAEIVRQSLAANLHDDLVPFLFVSQQAVARQLHVLAESDDSGSIDATLRDDLSESLRQIDGWLGDAMNVSRGILQSSHLPDFDASCWWHELRGLCQRLYPNEPRLHFVGEPQDVLADVALACYRIGGEAIRNAMRHSKASEIVVTTSADSSEPILLVQDDGCGFDSNAVGRDRFGLSGMRLQASIAGLDLAIESRKGGPTSVCLSMSSAL